MLPISEIENYVKALFKAKSYPALLYHNLSHTNAMVQHASVIAAHYLLAAAWFHDTGHLFGDLETRAERSVIIMKRFFTRNAVSSALILEISESQPFKSQIF